MPEVSLYVAAITAAAGLLGATIPTVAGSWRDSHRAEQDRRDRIAAADRQACIDLFRTAGELRMEVANAADYHGPEMVGRLAGIRKISAAVQAYAATVELLAPGPLGGSATELARAAEDFAAAAADSTDLDLGQMVRPPNPGRLSMAMEAFRVQAVTQAAQ